ncbi:Dynamin-2A [Zea mays]|uniref:Dynamin-2A n=1 Tax=Zea mays TaxID=4577 RepID=A0A1D6KPH5_MAIZE|nr:Dynamin-2A [Zea mays]
MEELAELADTILQGTALLADDDPSEDRPSRRGSSFLTVVAIGNVGAGKSAVLNGLIGHPVLVSTVLPLSFFSQLSVLPTGENGATRAPICVELQRDASLSSKAIVLQIDSKSQQVSASSIRHSLQDRLSKVSGKGRPDEITVKLCTSTAPPLKLIDIPGVDQRSTDESISNYAARNDAILLVIIPALQAPDVASSRALRIARELDSEGTRTIGVLSKIDQASGEQKALGAVQALLVNQGPRTAADIQWGAGWKVVASFEGKFPTRIKQLPVEKHFDMKNVKKVVLEADGYQPYLISPEKGLRFLIKGLLELAKEPSILLVDEVHRVLLDIVSSAANATPGLGRYPAFKREVIAIASTALDGFKNEARKMVVALVDMERAFVPPQHFIRLVQRS